MCELFAVSAKYPNEYNEALKEFYSHSKRHPHGWGLAVLDGVEAQISKEPLQASRSFYLHERLTSPVVGSVILAHIRYATIGNIEYRNCHPFTGKDDSGRRWTLVHNGTIFDYAPLTQYVKQQEGDTDSERIFLHILHQMNLMIRSGHIPTAKERFDMLDALISDMARGNKLNLLLYDGEYLYVHTNAEHTLYLSKEQYGVRFCTVPLERGDWESVPMTTLLAYKEGKLEFTGTNHGHVYEMNQQDMNYLYQIFANL